MHEDVVASRTRRLSIIILLSYEKAAARARERGIRLDRLYPRPLALGLSTAMKHYVVGPIFSSSVHKSDSS